MTHGTLVRHASTINYNIMHGTLIWTTSSMVLYLIRLTNTTDFNIMQITPINTIGHQMVHGTLVGSTITNDYNITHITLVRSIL